MGRLMDPLMDKDALTAHHGMQCEKGALFYKKVEEEKEEAGEEEVVREEEWRDEEEMLQRNEEEEEKSAYIPSEIGDGFGVHYPISKGPPSFHWT